MPPDLAPPLSLTEKLAQKRQALIEDERQSTQALLSLHAASLSELSSHALATTESITVAQREQLEKQLAGASGYVRTKASEIKDSLAQVHMQIDGLTGKNGKIRTISRDLDLLRATMKTRALVLVTTATASICLLMILAALGWSAYLVSSGRSEATELISQAKLLADQTLSASRTQIQQLNSQFCSSPAGKKYCSQTQ